MATFKIFRFSANLFKNIGFRTQIQELHTTGVRCLFGRETLGLENYQRQRLYMQDKVGDLKERFRVRMEEYLTTSDTNTIFTDDLKTIVHIAETQDDVETAVKMIKRFHNQTSVLKFSNFVFGPLVLRLLHHLEKPDLAFQLYTDPELSGFFSQMSSHILLMDLLFEAGQYERVLQVSDMVRELQVSGIRQPVDCVTLTLAACFKLNTAESLQYALKVIQQSQEDGSNRSLRSLVYTTYLALKQGEVQIAQDLLNIPQNSRTGQTPTAYVNVKAMVLSAAGSPGEALSLLEDSVQKQAAAFQTNPGSSVFPETLSALEDSIKESGNKDFSLRLEHLRTSLVSNSQAADISFEAYIFGPIVRRRNLQDGFKRRQRSGIGGYSRPSGQQEFHRTPQRNQRRGLNDEENMIL